MMMATTIDDLDYKLDMLYKSGTYGPQNTEIALRRAGGTSSGSDFQLEKN